MALHIGDTAPDFTADSSTGPIHFHEWIGSDWVFFFSHPGDFTPVCTTEIGRTAQLAGGFEARNVKPLGLSTDRLSEHLAWIKDVNDTMHTAVTFPIVADPILTVARLYGMIHPHESETAAVRSVFIVDPHKKIRLTMTYPMNVGRNLSCGRICERRRCRWRARAPLVTRARAIDMVCQRADAYCAR